jgi:hypothetical protein
MVQFEINMIFQVKYEKTNLSITKKTTITLFFR